MIFRIITDDITGANKSIGLFGKSLNDIKGIINSFKQNGFVNTLLNTPLINIDIDAIDNYNNAIRAGKTYEDALATARRTTNAETIALIESSHGAEVQIERVTAAQKASTIAAKAHSVALKAASIAGNMILFAAISKGIQLATTAIDNWIHRVEKANEAMNEAVGEYESAKSSLESVNTELEEQNKKLDELLAKDKLTYAEKGQLEELQAITQELLLQQDIEEKRAANASKEAADKAVDAYEKQYGRYDKTEEDLQEKLSYENFPIPEDADDVLGMIAAYIRAQELLEQSQREFDEAVKNGEDTTWLAEDVQSNIDAVDDYRQALDENISDLQEKRLALENEYNKAIEKRESGIEPLTSSEKDVIKTYESIYDVMRMVYEYTDKNTWKSMQIESVFDTEGIEKTKEELIEMVMAGEFDESTLQSYPKLSAALEQNKVSASELHNELEALAEAEGNVKGNTFNDKNPIPPLSITETVDQINTQLKPAFDSLKSAYQDIFSLDENTGEQLFSLEDVSIETFESIRAELEKLDEIDGINVDYASFENFVSVLSDTSSTSSEVQAQFNNLATSIIYTTNCTNMSAETFDLLVQSLTEMGVTNAEEVLTNLKDIQEELVRAGYDVANITVEEAVRLIELGHVSAETAEYLKMYLFQKELAQNPLSTSSDILALEQLCNTLGITGKMLEYTTALKNAFKAQELGATNLEPTIENLKSKIAALANGEVDFKFDFSSPKTAKSSKSKSEKDTTKEFDWIEQAIENVEKEVKALDDVVNSAYSTFSQKNEALAKEIGKVSEEIDLQQQAYAEYMRKADSIGLSDDYKVLVQNGAINIEDISDENLQKQIDAYQKWYDKAQNAADAVKQLKTDMKDLYVNAYELQTDNLKERLDSDSITQKQYLEGLKTAYEQFYANLEDYAQQYHEAVLEYLDEEKGYLNDVAGAAASLLDREIDSVRDDADEQENRLKKQIDLLENRKKPLEDELDALEDKAKREEQILNLQKAQYALAKAEYQRTKLVNYMPDTIVI